ncbi:MAG: peptide chain release factor 1 [Thermoprotei archaeon]|nr:MAG: peptide chain release factor 1 [Thermoprotei archaeon]RLE96655.1 MAG: peptide chain release factor 1 [Thermoprotei archaeon]
MLSELERYKLERFLKELKSKRGRGTELISLYIPAGRPISDVMSVLRSEYSAASNIKDRTTRHHVLDALTAVMQRLKLFRTTPPNGLVIFAGYVARGAPGSEKLEVHVLEPPEKLRIWLYRCDSRFYTEILEDMIAVKETYGLIVVDRGEAAFGVLKGKTLEVVKEIESGVPRKHRAGGQSARRFERIIEQLTHEFYKRVGEYANKIFLGIPDLKGIIVGGPGPAKEEFLKGDYLHYQLKEKVIGVFDVGYSGEAGIYELVKRAEGLLRDVQYVREREAVNKFLYHLARDTGMAVYGEEEVRRMLVIGAVETLLLSEELRRVRVRYRCRACGAEGSVSVEGDGEVKCGKCGAADVEVVDKTPVIEELAKLAERSGAEVVLVSTQTSEGRELYRVFGGVAAILRFKV